MTSKTNLTLREFGKEHLNILTCLKLIDKGWGEVCSRTMQSAWKQLWPKIVAERDLRTVRMSLRLLWRILSLDKSMGLKVDVMMWRSWWRTTTLS